MKFEIKTKPHHFSTPTAAELKKAYETRYSQKQAILRHLKKHKTLSTKMAHEAGIMAPAVRIKELREAGHHIQTVKDWNLNGLATYHLIKLAEPQQNEVKP